MCPAHLAKRCARRRALILVPALVIVLLLPGARPAAAQEPPHYPPVYLPLASSLRVTQPLAAGSMHTCAVLRSGLVRCWGDNSSGQLGDGSAPSGVRPVTVRGLPAAYAVTASDDTTCAATVDGLYCWGAGYGALPLRVDGVPPVATLEGLCAVGTDGSVTCWPAGGPAAEVPDLAGAVGLTAGGFPCALVAGGELACWGLSQRYGMREDPFTWPGVSGASAAASYVWTVWRAEYTELCVIDALAEVVCWLGGCYSGVGCADEPAAPSDPVAQASPARALAAGGSAFGGAGACAVRTDGRVVCWGDLRFGQGGLGTSFGGSAPIAGIEQAAVVDVGGQHVCAQDTGGQIYCWGTNSAGQLGNASAVAFAEEPLRVPLDGVQAATAASSFACAVGDEGRVWCWGEGSGSDLWGPQPSVFQPTLQPVSGATAVVAGPQSSSLGPQPAPACAFVPGTGIVCWQLDWVAAPDAAWVVPNSAGARSFAVANASQGCFTSQDGRVRCWGGEGAPAVVEGVSGATMVAAALKIGCAAAGGRVVCWDLPVTGAAARVGNLGDVTKVVLGGVLGGTDQHGCALRADGRVYCWGDNSAGQIGDGTTNDRPNPVRVSGLEGVRDLAASGYWTCALRSDGQVLCWGGSLAGQGSTPRVMFRMEGARTLAAGSGFRCVVASESLYCQGSNIMGQLASDPGWTPVRVEGLAE